MDFLKRYRLIIVSSIIVIVTAVLILNKLSGPSPRSVDEATSPTDGSPQDKEPDEQLVAKKDGKPTANAVVTDVLKESNKEVSKNKGKEIPSPSSPTSAAPNSDKQEPVAKIQNNSCFVINYKHKKTGGHKNIDDCSTHKNVVTFVPSKDHPELENKSVCIRVDGTPVRFESSNNAWTVGPVAGPDSTISVRYCPAKTIQDCKIPKDSFMSAIGGEESDEKLVNWDGSKGMNKNLDIDSEIDPELYPEGSDSNGLSLFKGWVESSTHSEPIARK